MTKANHLEIFLSAIRGVYSSGAGTKETSYYTALDNLLDGVGNSLKPKVRCIMQLKNLGAGNPDGGLFTAEQCDRKTGDPQDLSSPARGVIEVKAPAEEVESTATTQQIAKYWDHYKLVLVTNLRDWLLIGERDGKRVNLERLTLAKNEKTFLDLLAHPTRAQASCGAAFQDFLARVLRHNAPLAEPKDLAWLMASYAREARYRVDLAGADAAKQLAALKTSLEGALGVTFTDEDGEHFFRSSLVQTLFYGVFAAWVLRHEIGAIGKFDWRTAAYDLHVPMISALFEQLSQPSKLKALNLTEVLDWTADALNRVDKTNFFAKFESARSVQYFYEPFLEAFDPELRKQLGVWYTPEEIVRYQVARVDEVLRSELGLSNGFADPDVVVVDPCCGTGAYLVEVLRKVAEKSKAHGGDAVAAHELKQIAMTRLFGFELLPAPYVISHLQLGLLLRHRGAALTDEERVAVYLTNALTGWEPPKEPKTQVLPFPEFEVERDAAEKVKRTQKILVILGNPPYNAFSGVAQGEEQDLIAPYKDGLIKTWGIKKFNLHDLYVRFFRLAERRIGEQGGRGVVSFISNYSWTTEPSFVVLRQHLLANFDKLWVENMHGNRNVSEYAPDGRTSETVFARRGSSPGIKQGVVISLWVKKGETHSSTALVEYRDDLDQARAEDRRAVLLESIDDPLRASHYVTAAPSIANKFSFRPSTGSAAYQAWPRLTELGKVRSDGVFEKRAGALFDIDRERLLDRMKAYFDSTKTVSDLASVHGGFVTNVARFDAAKARAKVLKAEVFDPARIVRLCVRPFDVRWCYYSATRPLWNEPRPQLWRHYGHGNRFLISRLKYGASGKSPAVFLTSAIPDGQVKSPPAKPGAYWVSASKAP